MQGRREFLVSHHASVQFVFAVQPQPIYLTHLSAARPMYNHPLPLSQHLNLPYTIVPPIPHTYTPPASISIITKSNKDRRRYTTPRFFGSITDQHHAFSDRTTHNTDHRPRAGLTCLYLIYRYIMQAYTSRQYHARLSEGSTHRERNGPCKFSNRSIACGGEFKVTLR